MKKFLLIVLTLGAIGAIVAMVMKKRSEGGSAYADSLVSAADQARDAAVQAAEATAEAAAEVAVEAAEAASEAADEAAERLER